MNEKEKRTNEVSPTQLAPDEAQDTGSNKPASSASESSRRSRGWLVGLILVVLAFVVGFGPMWLKAGRHADERDAARRDVKLLQLETFAASAAIDARRGEYESARRAASQFFTVLRAEWDLGPSSSFDQSQPDSLSKLLTQRDNLITLLAGSDPASAESLTEVYLECRKTLRVG